MSTVSVDDSAVTVNNISMKSTSVNSIEFVASTSVPSHDVLIYGKFGDLSSNAVTKEQIALSFLRTPMRILWEQTNLERIRVLVRSLSFWPT